MTLTEELMTVALGATDERKQAAVRVLKGEVPSAASTPLTGPYLLGVGAAAKLLGISRCTMWRMVRAGRIRKVELFRGSFRISRAALEAFVVAPAMPSMSPASPADAVVASRPRSRIRQRRPSGATGGAHE